MRVDGNGVWNGICGSVRVGRRSDGNRSSALTPPQWKAETGRFGDTVRC